jgi:hypothetical protein
MADFFTDGAVPAIVVAIVWPGFLPLTGGFAGISPIF